MNDQKKSPATLLWQFAAEALRSLVLMMLGSLGLVVSAVLSGNHFNRLVAFGISLLGIGVVDVIYVCRKMDSIAENL